MSKEDTTKARKKPSTELTLYKPTPLATITSGSGSLNDYLRVAKAAPILSPEKERELALRLRDYGDTEAASELITAHLRLVIAIARQYLGYGLPFPDLIQEGNIGLMKAVKRYDPDNTAGARLVTFAMTWIRAEIQEYVIRNWKLVKVATTKSQRKLFFNLRTLKESDDLLTMEDTNKIATALEVKPKEVKEMEMRLLGHDIPIDVKAKDSEEESRTPEDWLYDEESEPVERIEQANYERLLDKDLPTAVEQLDERSRKIIKARWLYDETQGKGASLAQLASELGISQERVRQIEKRAFAQLKKILESKKEDV